MPKECSHPSGRHPYHTVTDDHWDNGEHWQDIECGYCGQLVWRLRVK